ncbi:MAG: 30S ribosomal protein S6 [Syntrophomonadaceae bacterium]|jgi:small subunit ribosomal protein S6|nr:30S ribosomal protein S6 [Syntrophomonadaceae bacterium]
MRKYEILMILKPDLSDEAVLETKERLQNIINSFGGEFLSEADGWGKRRLAYSIEDYLEGIYSLWLFNGQPETVDELKRVIKISDKIMRHIIVKQEK